MTTQAATVTEGFDELQSLIYSPPPARHSLTGSRIDTGWEHSTQPIHRPELVRPFLQRFALTRPLFVCVAAHTDTSSIPGASSAGASLDLIPFTAAADLEALLDGRPRSLGSVPSNPLGSPGPALITRASLGLAGMSWLPVTIGLRVAPAIPTMVVEASPGSDIRVMPGVPEALDLFDRGQRLGTQLCQSFGSLVIGETVPGGTTTAMSVLRALGLPSRVSASAASDVHSLKGQIVDTALRRAALPARPDPLLAVREIGDPMQPFVAGLILAVAGHIPIVLAGGTQMAAVLAIVRRLEHTLGTVVPREQVLLATTPWVARDPYADLVGILAAGGDWPAAIPGLDFSAMRCQPLRAYERFLVKEGVGAGGAALSALTVGRATLELLHAEIDGQYQLLLNGQ